jgi:hypothetical protein
MKKKSYFLKGVGLALILVLPVLLATQSTINAENVRMIRIYGGATSQNPARLEPSILSISKGTVVVWANFARIKEVKVIFEDGKSCSSCTTSPCLFSMKPDSCYVSSFVAFGETSSLRFVEKGTFSYKVTGGVKDVVGRIVVH